MPKREDLLADTKNDLDKFVLGPLLPNMEKKYWIFVDSQDIQNTKDGAPNLFFYVGSVGILQHAPNGSLEKLRARDDGVSCKQGLCVL